MKTVTTEELIYHKILPFNIYNELGEKLFAAGEILTPGKLLQLKNLNVLYRDGEDQIPQGETHQIMNEKVPIEGFTSEDETEQNQTTQPPSTAKSEIIQEPNINKNSSGSETENKQKSPLAPPSKPVVKKKELPPVIIEGNDNIVIEKFDMNPSTILRNKLSVDDIDIRNYKGPINKKSKIDPQTQLKIKAFYTRMLDMMNSKTPIEMLGLYANIRDKIVQDIIFDSSEVFMSSELKLLGEYRRCHALNTAILSGMLAKKLDMPENAIYDIVLAGLLHDIGEDRLSQDLISKTSLSEVEKQELQAHTKIGYRFIKMEMDLPEHIAKVALEHHESNDGSGYPAGKSGDKISQEAQIVSVCNFFDNLTSNRTTNKIKNTKEALKVLLCLGTHEFAAQSLYTFVHMFSYNDTTNFEEMVM